MFGSSFKWFKRFEMRVVRFVMIVAGRCFQWCLVYVLQSWDRKVKRMRSLIHSCGNCLAPSRSPLLVKVTAPGSPLSMRSLPLVALAAVLSSATRWSRWMQMGLKEFEACFWQFFLGVRTLKEHHYHPIHVLFDRKCHGSCHFFRRSYNIFRITVKSLT